MTLDDILGKTLTFTYRNDTYRIDVLSDTKVRWEQLRGEDPGSGDEETYVFSALGGGLGMITWVEADGLGLSNVLDIAAGTVTTHAKMGRDVYENPGTLTIAD